MMRERFKGGGLPSNDWVFNPALPARSRQKASEIMGCVNDPQSAEDLLHSVLDIVLAAEILNERLHHRLYGEDGKGIAFFALRLISAAGRRGLSQAELSRQSRISPASITRLVDSSEEAGVVSRIAHPTDRRLNMIVLTLHGQAMIDGITVELVDDGSSVPAMDRTQHDCLRDLLSNAVATMSRLV